MAEKRDDFTLSEFMDYLLEGGPAIPWDVALLRIRATDVPYKTRSYRQHKNRTRHIWIPKSKIVLVFKGFTLKEVTSHVLNDRKPRGARRYVTPG